jgi:prophage antirepressor-like protein
MTNLSVFSAQYDGCKVRITLDGRVSVFDAIAATLKKKNPRSDWERLTQANPEVVAICDSFQFPGRGQQLTPVADEEGLYQILMLLPGSNAAEFRKWAASILARYRQGDTTLAEEIIGRASSTAKNNVADHTDQQLLSVQDQLAVIDYIYSGFIKAGVDPKITESAKMSAIAAQFPSMAPAIESAKQSLMLQTPDEGHRYNPTKLGEILAERLGLQERISSRKVNAALQTVGFQVAEHDVDSKGKKSLVWHLTPVGESYGRVFLESAQGNSKTIPVIRWLPQVLDEISHLFVNK